MDRIQTAVSTFAGGFSCSQAVLSAFADELGIDRATALKLAGAFGGGIAGLGQTCGAVTGALMVIGARHGRTRAEDTAAKEKTYELARQFMRCFGQLHGSIVCRELLGADVSTPEGKKIITDKKLSQLLCPAYVRTAAEILEEIL